jgi:hypothetical protein
VKPVTRNTLDAMAEELAAHPWRGSDLEELVAPRFGIITGFQGLLEELEALRLSDLGETPPAGPLRPKSRKSPAG